VRKPTIYFIQHGQTGPIKIGQTKTTVAKRFAGLQTCSAEPLRVIATMATRGQVSERALHAKFRGLRTRGEWYKPERELIDFIAAHGTPFDIKEERASKRNQELVRKAHKYADKATEACQARAIIVLLRNNFTEDEVISALGFSRRTFYRRMEFVKEIETARRGIKEA
jgi:DNA-binding NtrC family response regulator